MATTTRTTRVPGDGPTNRGRRALVMGLLAGVVAVACQKGSPSGTVSESGAPGQAPAASRPRLKIAVIPKGTTHEFWKSVHAGAVKAARASEVDIVWKGPLKEDDLKAQIDVVQTFIAQGVSGIVLAPLNDAALQGPVRKAKSANIPVVIFDSDLQRSDHVSFVATDNVAAGKLGGEELAKLVGEKGKVALLRYQVGSASTENRERGFLEAVRGHPGLEVTSDNQYGGATTETALQKSEALLLASRAQAGGLTGVFTPNESTTFGMLLALKKTKTARAVKLVGFDASEKLVAALREGDIDALVVQDPFNMGFLAVQSMVDHLRGKPVEKRIDTGSRVVTRANVDDPAIRSVIKPDLAPWLE